MTAPKYRVIRNARAFFNKFEVWYSGDAESMNSRGYLEIVQVTKKVDAFRTEEAANDYITYQQQIRAFKEEK